MSSTGCLARPGFTFEHYQGHSGLYRTIPDLSTPWAPSPTVYARDILTPFGGDFDPPPQSVAGRRKILVYYGWDMGELRRKDRIRNVIHRWKMRIYAIAPKKRKKNDPPPPEPVPLSDWKAYGYYAYPHVNGGYVRNLSPKVQVKHKFNLDEMAAGLVSPHGDHHPERWIPGTKHEALPPRPTRWRKPRRNDPLPFPWECQLNPYLVYNQFGASPLKWDVSFPPALAWLNVYDELARAIAPPDQAQPATWPFLTHMYIKGVVDDPSPYQFRWSFTIQNDDGINLGDVLNAIFENLQQFVSIEEEESWTRQRREHAHRSYQLRAERDQVRKMLDPGGFEPGLRRLDYFGFEVHFRGLQPNPNKNEAGWVMFLSMC